MRIRFLPAFLFVLLFGVQLQAAPQIPALNWEKRSDWVSIKTDVTPPAKGDGVTDDTDAIQKALDGAASGSVVYLPAGTYRITRTLKLQPKSRLTGVEIIGNGRDTTLVWDGQPGQNMWLDDGITNCRYIGVTFDGRNKAAAGVYHHNGAGHFETEVTHRDLAFFNFTGTALLTDTQPALAEIMIENCLFDHCKRAIAFMAFNDYDYTIDGCEFRDCETGIQTFHGNAYVRNCHFERSKTADLVLVPEHGTSVRRCTSTGSGAFITYANPIAPVTVEDCIVDGWTNPNGAIIIDGAPDSPTCAGGPFVVFDTVFTHGPDKSVPIKMLRKDQHLLLSHNTPADAALLASPLDQAKIYVIPDGKLKGSLTSATQSFLSDTASIPTTVIDAKRDFGAKGNGQTDDTEAIQKTIDAARQKGHGAIAYLPTGFYVVTKTLEITGSDYFVGGTGLNTGLMWRGTQDGAIIHVEDPDHITLDALSVGNSDTGKTSSQIDILQTSSGKPSFITYDDVNVFGMYQKKPFIKGLWLKGLGKDSTVLIPRMEGNLHMIDAAQATILVGNSYEGSVVVEGKDKHRDGITGLLTHLGTICTHALYVKDNQNFIASDFYIEQADNGMLFEGSPDDPTGRVTMQCPKLELESSNPATPPVGLEIRNYSGQIFLGHEQFHSNPEDAKFIQTGDRPVDFFLWATTFYAPKLSVSKTAAANLYLIGNIGVDHKLKGYPVDENAPADAVNKLSVALDDLRRLSELDLRLSHPGVVKP